MVVRSACWNASALRVLLAAAALTIIASSCSESSNASAQDAEAAPSTGGRQGTGGERAGGGSLGGGGASTSGGRTGTGGDRGSGGATTGATSLGGNQSNGGRPTTGGTMSAGGASGTGGRSGTGGTLGTGGRSDSGSGAGGIGRNGGASGAPNSGGASGRGGTGGSRSTGDAGGTTSSGDVSATGGGTGTGGSTAGCDSPSLSYDQAILCDKPVAYLAMNKLSGSEPDLTGNNHSGTYKGGAVAQAILPNGDTAADFDGSSQYLTVPSSPALSIPTTGNLTWEAWIRPDVLQFPNDSNGYVDWMGKCEDYSPTCEWEARMYSTTNSENRCNRISAYVFNETAGLGSAADWQPTCGLIQAGEWYHVVGEYTLESHPSNCSNASTYPGSIEIWVNGVKWNHASHGQTGCMSQYNIIPKAHESPLNIGTMSRDAWFPGAIAKVAFYDFLLSDAQVAAHYERMSGKNPTGKCADTCSF